MALRVQAGLSMQGIYQLHSAGALGIKLWEFIVVSAATLHPARTGLSYAFPLPC